MRFDPEKEIRAYVGEKGIRRPPTITKRDSAEEIAKKYGLSLLYCERLHVKATELPCGKREECYWEPVCPKVADGNKHCICCGTLLDDAKKIFCSSKCSHVYYRKGLRSKGSGGELLPPRDEWDEIIEANGL